MISIQSKDILRELGLRIRRARVELGEKQVRFAARLGVSVPTLRKLERGDPTVALGTFVETLVILQREEDLQRLLAPGESLFDRWDATRRGGSRQRVSATRGSAER